MGKYEARIQFTADTDEAAKQKAAQAARAVGGKVDKTLGERLTFRALGEEE